MSEKRLKAYNPQKHIGVVFWGAASIACMVIIFYMSHKPAPESSDMSGTIVRWLLAHGIGAEFVDSLEVIVRKCAHMAEYFVLTLCVTLFLINIKGAWNLRLGIAGAAFSVVYAVSDEVHQLFVEGRAGKVVDVLIDTVGVMLAFAMIMVAVKLTIYRNNSVKKDKNL